jgi:mRNA interferase HigB
MFGIEIRTLSSAGAYYDTEQKSLGVHSVQGNPCIIYSNSLYLAVHIISRKALADFWDRHPSARGPMSAWYKVVENAEFTNFASVRETFNSADRVEQFVVFNVGGDGFRVVTAIHFDRGKLYIRQVFTHAEYERWTRRRRSGR